jgi:NAD(P)H-dependent FMN reductase
MRAQYHLRQSMVFLDMYPLNQPEVAIPHAAKAFRADGELTDETSRKLIRELLARLAQWTRVRSAGATGARGRGEPKGEPLTARSMRAEQPTD